MKTPKISIQIGADTKKLKRDMKKADGIVSKFTTAAKWGLAGVASAAGAAAFKLGVDGVQAAIADQASQVQLATALANTTKATEAQIKANEDYITQTQLRYGIEDVLLRKSLGKLATVTGSLTKAQEMQAVALDVSAGAGISLEAATTLVTKALQGSFTGFKKLGVVLDENTIKNKDSAKAIEILGGKYEGAAAKAADTTAGKMKRIEQAWGEAVEGIGEAVLPELEKVADWATSPEGQRKIEQGVKDLTKLFEDLATAIGNVGTILDNITPDPDSPMGKLLELASREIVPGASQYSPWNVLTAKPPAPNSPMSSSGWRTTGGAPVNITIQGAIDPVSTARQIQKLLNQVPRQPIPVDISHRSK